MGQLLFFAYLRSAVVDLQVVLVPTTVLPSEKGGNITRAAAPIVILHEGLEVVRTFLKGWVMNVFSLDPSG